DQRPLSYTEGYARKQSLTQSADVSANTASAIAGLKPWSSEWVFRGDEDQNPQIKALLDKSNGQSGGTAELSRQIRELMQLSEMAQAQGQQDPMVMMRGDATAARRSAELAASVGGLN